MIVGGSWGATLALAYAQAHPDRVTGIVLRATFLGTRAELEGAFLDALPRFYPGLSDDFLGVLPPEERAEPLDAYWRRILDSDPAVHGPAARAWGDTERILSEHTLVARPARSRFAELDARAAFDAVHGSALFPERLLHETGPAARRSRQARRHSRHHRAGPLRSAVPAGDVACACRGVARTPKFASSKAPAIRCTIPACGTP